MDYALYIASLLGAAAVWLTMPAERRKPVWLGVLLGVGTLAGLLVYLATAVEAEARPNLYYFIFTFIAIFAAVRVITHPRPVYSALFFVLVVMSVAGLFVVLEAEFMAFAMIIIYAGAILVTYLFVIMLATLPQAPGEEEQTPIYDRVAREPLSAVILGFALIAVLSSVMFGPGIERLERRPDRMDNLAAAVEFLPRRVVGYLQERDAIPAGLDPDQVQMTLMPAEGRTSGPVERLMLVPTAEGAEAIELALNEPLPGDIEPLAAQLGQQIGNIDRVGVTLFLGHNLGIELAGVILLLSMVGAIVIGRKPVPDEGFSAPGPPPSADVDPDGESDPKTKEGMGEPTKGRMPLT